MSHHSNSFWYVFWSIIGPENLEEEFNPQSTLLKPSLKNVFWFLYWLGTSWWFLSADPMQQCRSPPFILLLLCLKLIVKHDCCSCTIFSVQEVPVVLHIWLTLLSVEAQNSNRLVHLKFFLLLIQKELEHGWKRKFTVGVFIGASSCSLLPSPCALQEVGNGKCLEDLVKQWGKNPRLH